VSVAWFVGSILAIVALVLMPFTGLWLASSVEPAPASAGIGAVSVGISAWVLALPTIPPVALFLAWLVARWRRRVGHAV
jgi:hypothetical protein